MPNNDHITTVLKTSSHILQAINKQTKNFTLLTNTELDYVSFHTFQPVQDIDK